MADESKSRAELLAELRTLRAQHAVVRHTGDLLHTVSDAVITIDLETNVLTWNRAAEVLYGWEADEVIGRPITDVMTTWYASGLQEEDVSELFFEQGSWRGVVTQTTKDGDERIVEASVSLLRDEAGNAAGMVAINRDITEQEGVKDALRRSEAGYRALVANFPNGLIALFDHDLRYTVINGQGLAEIGLSAADLEGKRLRDIFPPEIAERDEPALQAALQGETHDSVVQFGDQYFRVITLPVRDEAGEIIAGMVMSQNVTEWKTAEERLSNTLQQLELSIKTGKLGIWRLYVQTGELQWNDQLFVMYGISREQFDNRLGDWGGQVHPEDVEDANKRLAEAMEGLAVYDVAFRIIRPDGEVRHISASASPVYDADDNIVEVIGVNIDVTHIKQQESDLRESEARYRSLFDNTLDAILLIDDAGAVVMANPAACVLLDYPPGELPGMTLDQLSGGDPRLWAGLTARGIVQEESTVRTKDGTIRAVELRAVANVQPGLHLGVLRDITLQKEQQAELERYQAHLEELVTQRTTELNKANQELKTLTRLKDEWVSNVSHELRTPLTNLKIRLFLLSQYPEALSKHLPVLMRETNRLNLMIEELLKLSRLDQGRVDFSIDRVDLTPLIRMAVTDRILNAEHEDVTLLLRIDETLPSVMADAGLIEQVLSIMLTNAIAYTPPGGEVVVEGVSAPAEAGFAVSDTGPGIPLTEQTKIFDRFYRGKVGRRSGKEGTGLGLAIAQEIVQRHSGRIEVESTGIPGEGCRFTVWLPTAANGIPRTA